ncbi:MFS transporter [Cryptosporangium phraense]|uniref:MFS transporter n=1 Tax=Cryptosporangium phraense TaxID=2593070 RepID=A0A545AJW0_9ACTN|nr:MFS transporter [Cryptosporangium phraense]TQS41579.1 MFS transporter [Cryptosporangium phraense]
MESTTEVRAGYRTVLRHPIAGRLVAVKAVSEVGDFVGLAALLLLGYQQTGSLLGAAAVYTARALPAILVATLLGGWLDVLPRRPTLVALALAGACALALPALYPAAATALAASAILGAIRAAYAALTTAVVAEAVEPAIQLPYFGVAALINLLAQVGGIAVGSGLTVALGPRVALLADLVSFLVAAAMLGTLPGLSARSRRDRLPPGAGFVLIWQQPTLRVLALLTWATLICSVLPETVATNAPPGWIPVVMASSALGGAVFAAVVGRLRFLERPLNQTRTAAVLGFGLVGGAVVLFCGGHPLLLAGANVVIGAATGWTVGAQATFARLAPVGRMGQIEATMIASNVFLEGVGVLVLSGIAVAAGSDGAGYLVGGVLVLGAAFGAERRLRVSGR